MTVTEGHAQSPDHSHLHVHPHVEAAPGPSHGAVILDIGGSVGAAVVVAPPQMDALEIEIRPAGATWDSTHVAVRKRQQRGQPELYAAVFPALTSGAYDIRVRFGGPDATVHRLEVTGGHVTTLHWTDGAPSV
jgi:hypothetical protein